MPRTQHLTQKAGRSVAIPGRDRRSYLPDTQLELRHVRMGCLRVFLAAARVTDMETTAGTIRVAVTEGFGTYVVAPALASLIAARSGLKIEWPEAQGSLADKAGSGHGDNA
jgi:hypothetical protein